MEPDPLLEALRADHRQVLAELETLEQLTLAPRAFTPSHEVPAFGIAIAELLARLERRFTAHAAAEDRGLFPALARALPAARDSLRPLQAEHDELGAMLAELAATLRRPESAARDEQIVVCARDLVDLLRIHIRKEEAVAFRVAERLLTPAELGAIEAHRTTDPAAPQDPPTPNP
jgi:hemerythrin-like domain-containing protein